jgi:hypothetical protein
MPITVQRPLKITAFDANGIGRQAYQVRKRLQDKNRRALFSDTHLKPHMRVYIPNYDIYTTNGENGHKGELP